MFFVQHLVTSTSFWGWSRCRVPGVSAGVWHWWDVPIQTGCNWAGGFLHPYLAKAALCVRRSFLSIQSPPKKPVADTARLEPR